jgi:ferrous-iron efflux pump FieF
MDVMVSLAAMAALIYAAKPADDDHAFGHTSAEDLVSLGQALFILLSAGVIAVAAVKRLWASAGQPTPSATIHAEAAGIAVMTLSIVVTLGLVASQGRVARLTGSRVIAADRLHYLGDLLPNLGAIAALWASARFSIVTVDAVIALGTAGVLALGALRIARRRGMR